jgi:hypothetical protein
MDKGVDTNRITHRRPRTEFAGTWWRFSAYKIRNGAIRPARGAVLGSYDPWQEFYASSRRVDRAYLELADLGRIPPSGFPSRTVEDERAGHRRLLNWCQRFGLLGVMLQETERVELEPRRAGRDKLGEVWRQRVYFRSAAAIGEWDSTGSGWRLWETTQRERRASRAISRTVEGPTGLELGERPLAEAWGPYFPDIRESRRGTHQYPSPGSEEFWRAYAEPVDRFLAGAGLVAGILEAFAEAKQKPIKWTALDRVSVWRRSNLVARSQFLNDLLSSSSPALSLGKDGVPAFRWSAPSLLGHFAMMVALEVIQAGRVPGHCACGRFFMAQHPSQTYCGDRCKRRLAKRRYRARGRKGRGTA